MRQRFEHRTTNAWAEVLRLQDEGYELVAAVAEANGDGLATTTEYMMKRPVGGPDDTLLEAITVWDGLDTMQVVGRVRGW